MKAPQLGQAVFVCDGKTKKRRDDTVWTVWSQSPGGYWLMRRDANGQVVWEEQSARCLKSTRPDMARG